MEQFKAVPQFVQEIVGVKGAARIGETSSEVEDGLLVNNIAFALLRIDPVCCLSWLGPGGLLLDARNQGHVSLERLHHTAEQFVMVPQIVEIL